MTARTDRVLELQSLVGDALAIDDLGTGWPSLATLHVDGSEVPLAIFVSAIGRSHRSRDDIERRFQNPAGDTALTSVPGRQSVLVGLWTADDLVVVDRPVLALADAGRREGRTTRWSVFLLLESLKEAVETGWSSNVTDSNETIYYMTPALLPVAIVGAASGAEPNERSIYKAIAMLGLDRSPADPVQPDSERVRRTVTALVRDSRFSGAVLSAYDRQCAMCGLGIGLVQGAHIYPASAPGSLDDVSNGLALCANHHLAFDRHLVAVRSSTFDVIFHPDVIARAGTDRAVASFVEGTRPDLRRPSSGTLDPGAFVKRYDYYREHYGWLGLG